MLGGGNVEAMCVDGKRRICHIRGKMNKKIWISVGDLILIGLRDYQDSKADVISKYSPEEARNLKTYGELPDTSKFKLIFEVNCWYFLMYSIRIKIVVC
jgi:translation initiation factor 1A